MRIEPELDQGRLLELLRQQYRCDVAGLAFVPYGIDSWSYVATCRDGSRAFVKLTRRAPSTAAGESEMALLTALAAAGVPVPCPIARSDRGFVSALAGYEVQVFEYLEGRSLEGETVWAEDLYARVAETVAAVHASTSAVRPSVERREQFELPFLRPFTETLVAIEARGALSAADEPTLATLREMVVPRAAELRLAIERLEDLRDRARVRHSDEVLCHTDIWGSNLLLGNDGTLHLLDWNGALLGPPEHDLFMFAGTDFFPADRFGWFLDRYEGAFRRGGLGAETLGFYLYRRNLEDLAGFVGSIAEGRMEAMGPIATLGVVADLLAELPDIESRIEHVVDVLAARRDPRG